MSLSEAELKLIDLAAESAAKKAIASHVKSCPFVTKSKAFLAGFGFALTLLGGGMGAAIVKLLKL